jgi:hypothetical protein
VIDRLSPEKEERLMAQAYQMPGVRGLLINTLFHPDARAKLSSIPRAIVSVFRTAPVFSTRCGP